jgi:hypothetical protein
MHRIRTLALLGLTLGAILAAALPTVAANAAPAPAASSVPACPPQSGPFARCYAHYRPSASRVGLAVSTPDGWGAQDIAAAYRLPVGAGPSTLVAVSIAYDSPTLEYDLNVYWAEYGLPPCTSDTGCFTKVNQNGDPFPLPTTSFGWGLEATLDVAMISAVCPTCRILVVEGFSPGFADLAATVTTAVRLGAHVVSNSYGARETGQSMRYAAAYHQPGHVVVAASGDLGFTAASFPANLATVTAVGGTTLTRADNARGWAETAWAFGGSGCSAYVAKPAAQTDPHCGGRTTADVAAVADNVALYTSDLGWFTTSGTSASAPIIAGVYALAATPSPPGLAGLYAHPEAFFDVVTGTNDYQYGGAKCGNDYLCVAGPGYDAPTGLGTPNGVAGF